MNRKSPLSFLLLSFFILLSFSSFGQKSLSETDQSLRYSIYSRLGLKVIPVKLSETRYKLQFVIEKIEESPDFNSYSFTYAVLNSYDQPITTDLTKILTESELKVNSDRHWFFEKEVEVPVGQTTAIAYLSAIDTRQGDLYIYHMDLKSQFVDETPNFGIYFANEVPFDQTYINQNESLLFKTASSPSVQSYFYPMTFDVPFPPMEARPADVPKEVSAVYEGDFLENNPKKFNQEGYYFFQTDTLSASGLLLKSTHEAFPKVKDWDEMIQMVTYISTRKEHETLLMAQDKKKALDQYWISITRNPETAKELIKNYFQMVEFANILFTDFKEGWKTDRGMVYIVMGPPAEVNFFEDREVWTYAGMDASSKIKFTFVRAKTILTPNFYTLNRSRAYQPVWFKNISQWRSGRMAF